MILIFWGNKINAKHTVQPKNSETQRVVQNVILKLGKIKYSVCKTCDSQTSMMDKIGKTRDTYMMFPW